MVLAPSTPTCPVEERHRQLGQVTALWAAAGSLTLSGPSWPKKTGVKLEGVAGINPVNGKKIPIFISDYVLVSYGTGAIMAVPAHDDRDWEFAKKFGCEIIEVVQGGDIRRRPLP